MKISVVMPVYNTKEEYLRQSIESILNQTYRDFEFIIINNGSTNNAEEVILSYRDTRIKYIKEKENQGIAKTCNNAIKLARGEYIARMDSDDVSMPNRFEKQVEYLDKHKEVSILGTNIEILGTDKTNIYPKKVTYFDLLIGCRVCHPVVMFRKEIVEKYDLQYSPQYKCEDYELWSRAIKHVNIENLQEFLLKYRIHENNISSTTEDFNNYAFKVRENMLDYLTNDKKIRKKIVKLLKLKLNNELNFMQKIFSVKNTYTKVYKVITILGIQFKIKRNKKL